MPIQRLQLTVCEQKGEVVKIALSFESLLARFGAPALAGIKPANLLVCQQQRYPQLPRLVEQYNHSLNSSGICFEIIYACPRYSLLLLYRPQMLSKLLENPDLRTVLDSYGYRQCRSLPAFLRQLRYRFAEQKGFPHEIGLFLGYPLADFQGYRDNQGRNYLLRGHWKVYQNQQQAEQLFARYDRVCEMVARKIEQGRPIQSLFAKNKAR